MHHTNIYLCSFLLTLNPKHVHTYANWFPTVIHIIKKRIDINLYIYIYIWIFKLNLWPDISDICFCLILYSYEDTFFYILLFPLGWFRSVSICRLQSCFTNTESCALNCNIFFELSTCTKFIAREFAANIHCIILVWAPPINIHSPLTVLTNLWITYSNRIRY